MSNFPHTMKWKLNVMLFVWSGHLLLVLCFAEWWIFLQLRIYTYFIPDFRVIVTFLRLSGEEKGASGHPSLQEHERIHTALEIPWLMYCCYKVCIHKMQVWRNASSTVMLQPGLARAGNGSREWQIWCHQQCFSTSTVGKKCLGVFVSEEKSSNYW